MPIGLVAKSRKRCCSPCNKQMENTCADSLFGNQPDRHGISHDSPFLQ